MEVILRDDVEKLGRRGEIVQVAEGYGRNYLLPQGLALKVTPENRSLIERERKAWDVREAKERAQCEEFADINEQARQLIEKMNQPIPPFVNNFRGLRLSIESLVMNPSAEMPIPEDVRGLMAVHVEQPEMFVGMAQMFLPDLSTLTLAPGEPPVQIPESLLSMPGFVAYAAMSDDAIAMSVGDGMQDQLGGFLDRDAGPAGRLVSVEYDVATYSEYQLKMLENMQQDGDDAMMAISRASLEANRDSGDRNRFTLDVTADGMVLTTRMTYK